MYVWFDGKVNPCDADYKSYLSYGNVKENSIKEIWENNIIAKTRQNHLNGKRRNINPCNKCGVTYIK
jgi:radical SAM protein with 4Fe4S-binding SPASM domain